jgi:hypothetical protein
MRGLLKAEKHDEAPILRHAAIARELNRLIKGGLRE